MTFSSVLPVHPMQSTGDTIRTFRANLETRRRARKAYNQTFNELSAMSSRELADVGIDPADIPAIAAEAAAMAS